LISLSVRKHRGVENSLHRVPDVDFREDYSRKGAGNAARNFTLLNRIAVNLLKNGRTAKAGVRGKRLKAGWDNN
jgi:predicted transposase YbfD/YdcC